MPKVNKDGWEVVVHDDRYRGYFERQKDGAGGELWILKDALVDYDGTYELPSAVAAALEEMGIKVSKEFK